MAIGKSPFLALACLAAGLAGPGTAREAPAKEAAPVPPGGGAREGGRADERPQAVPLLEGEARIGRWVLLDGSLSRDPEGVPQRFEWTQRAGPAVPLLAEQAGAAKVWVLIEKKGAYRFALRVKNRHGWSAPEEVACRVPPGPPLIPLDEALFRAGLGELIHLSGEGWRQVAGRAVRLRLAPGGRETSFRLVKPGLYLFEALHAGDIPIRRGFYLPPGREGKFGDRRPVVRLQSAHAARVGQEIELDGSLAKDPDGDPLRAKWLYTEGRGLQRTGRQGFKATFVASRKGLYRVVLLASDGRLDSFPAETFLHVYARSRKDGDTSAPVPGGGDPLRRRVTLGLFESNLDRAVQKFPSQCGVVLRINPFAIPPRRLRHTPLHLGLKDAPLRLLLDWIAHQTDTVYRRETDRSVWLTRSGIKLNEEPLKSAVYSVDALYQEKDGSDLLNLLRACFRGVLKSRPDANLSIQTQTQKVVALLPVSASRRLKEILLHLRLPARGGLEALPERGPAERRLRRMLGEQTFRADWRERRLDLALRDLSSATGLAAGFDPRAFPGARRSYKKLPHLTLRFKDAPLRQAVREIVHAAGFDGCQLHPDGGLWFYKGAEPYPRGESLWETGAVRAYAIGAILKKLPMLSGEAVAFEVTRRVYPDSWKDPASVCRYHRATGKLLVIHGEAAQRRVLAFLHDLQARGEWALGPVPDAGKKKRSAPENSRKE